MEFKVIDASVLLHSNLDFSKQIYLAPNSVILEIIDERAKILVDAAIKNKRLKIVDPGETALRKTVSKAVETGDIQSLSKTDLDVIALALEKNAVIASDDYAIQNTARQLGLKTEATMQDGIKKAVKWIKLCEGCGRRYETSKRGLCQVCGSKLRKKPFT